MRYSHIAFKEGSFNDEIDKEQTRLIIRLRANYKPGLWTTLIYLIFEPGDFLMLRKELLGIKQRVERVHRSTSERVGAMVHQFINPHGLARLRAFCASWRLPSAS